VGVTDYDWFHFLSSLESVDEVNFWQPGGQTNFKALQPGELFLFKLHAPRNFIVGAGANLLALYLEKGNQATWQEYAAAGAVGAAAGAIFNVEAVGTTIAGSLFRIGASKTAAAAGTELISGGVTGGLTSTAQQYANPNQHGASISISDVVLATLSGVAGSGLSAILSGLKAPGLAIGSLNVSVQKVAGQVGASLTDAISAELTSDTGLPAPLNPVAPSSTPNASQTVNANTSAPPPPNAATTLNNIGK
jgi:hypothetical protein